MSDRRRINFNNGWHYLMVKHRKKDGRTHKNETNIKRKSVNIYTGYKVYN